MQINLTPGEMTSTLSQWNVTFNVDQTHSRWNDQHSFSVWLFPVQRSKISMLRNFFFGHEKFGREDYRNIFEKWKLKRYKSVEAHYRNIHGIQDNKIFLTKFSKIEFSNQQSSFYPLFVNFDYLSLNCFPLTF